MAAPLRTTNFVQAQLFAGDEAVWTSPDGKVTDIRNVVLGFLGGGAFNASLVADTTEAAAVIVCAVPDSYIGTFWRETRIVLPPGEAVTFRYSSDGIGDSCTVSCAGFLLTDTGP